MTKRILTVDPSQTMRVMLSHTLRGAGFEVAEGADGAEALVHLDEGQVDLIITDTELPDMDGVDLVRRVRDGAHEATPVLILTTECDAGRKAEGKAAGANGWIVKPFDPGRLLEIVDTVCR